MTHLVLPRKRYEASYRAAQREVKRGRERTDPRGNFVAGFRRRGRAGLTFWLVGHGRYIGLVQLRLTPSSGIDPRFRNHIYYEIRPSMRRRGYGTIALALALRKAREYGLKRVYLVSRQTNAASRKIIERNGGVLMRAVAVKGHRAVFLKYRIDLGKRMDRDASFRNSLTRAVPGHLRSKRASAQRAVRKTT